ncbi:MAG: YdcF family protein [Methylococcaceae bacterium]|nr:YdcF family protein [Methylococcaceae bacterium]MCI0667838.1 YdcF family protein [Methylococcaceae bacterium]MCI0733434.1 YdcF family protein [Methylococcaceae bacterium]
MNPSEILRKADRDARFVLMVSMLVLLGSAGFFLVLILVRVLYQAKTSSCAGFPRDSVYLVFGKQLVGNQPDREYIARLDRLIECGCRRAILMGGQTPGNDLSEALAGLEYLKSRRITLHAVHLEQDSRSTLENLRNSRALIRNSDAVIISNRYHLCRCSILATSFAIQHHVCAAEQHFRLDAETIVKCLIEAFYIHWFYSGKYWAKLTRNRRMLTKIT